VLLEFFSNLRVKIVRFKKCKVLGSEGLEGRS
jgi:hypothetical protein